MKLHTILEVNRSEYKQPKESNSNSDFGLKAFFCVGKLPQSAYADSSLGDGAPHLPGAGLEWSVFSFRASQREHAYQCDAKSSDMRVSHEL